jgi:oxygen-dependent protoporphyrinogen oxidase
MATLPQALALALPAGAVQTGVVVQRLQRAPRGWQVETDHGVRSARRLVLAVPPRVAARLLSSVDVEDLAPLAEVQMAQVALVHLGGPDPDQRAPRGFGVLMAPGEDVRAMGMLWPSSLFAQRAPAGHWQHAVFLGGTADAQVLDLSDESLITQARIDHQRALAAQVGPTPLPCDMTRVLRWREAIPQYVPGHRARVRRLRELVEGRLSTLVLAGNYLDGVAVDDAARSGLEAVTRLARAA